MKCFVTGANGQLGSDLICQLKSRGYDVLGTDVQEMDITDSSQVERVMGSYEPDVVFHCAAYTAVDRAEDETELCEKINAFGTKNIAKVCAKLGCKMIYISTDYVFDGEGTRPWEPDDPRSPLNAYGKYKYEGELEVEKYLSRYFIIRISWVFGKQGKNFVDTMLRLGKEHDELTVVDDQIGSPTYTWDLSRLLIDMAETEKYGAYHATNEGICSWYEFAKEIFRIKGMKTKVTPVSSDQYPVKAKRPKNSRMSKQKLMDQGFEPLPDWKDAVRRYLEQQNKQIK